jgi:hypothetical protein
VRLLHYRSSPDGVKDRMVNTPEVQARGTGRPMWSTQVFVLGDDGGEVIAITTADS